MIEQGFSVDKMQLKYMLHCIGFVKQKVSNNKYLAWRNYFITSNHDEELDNLVIQGLAVKRDFKLGGGPNTQCYSVSEEGFKYLESILNIKIIMDRR